MGVAAAQVGLDHEAGDGFRIGCGQPGGDKGADDEGREPVAGNARVVRGHAGMLPLRGRDWFNARPHHKIKPPREVSPL